MTLATKTVEFNDLVRAAEGWWVYTLPDLNPDTSESAGDIASWEDCLALGSGDLYDNKPANADWLREMAFPVCYHLQPTFGWVREHPSKIVIYSGNHTEWRAQATRDYVTYTLRLYRDGTQKTFVSNDGVRMYEIGSDDLANDPQVGLADVNALTTQAATWTFEPEWIANRYAPGTIDEFSEWDLLIRHSKHEAKVSHLTNPEYIALCSVPATPWLRGACLWALRNPSRVLVVRNFREQWHVQARGNYVHLQSWWLVEGQSRYFATQDGLTLTRIIF